MNLTEINKLDKEQLFKDHTRYLEVLLEFREIVKERILGQEDPEWRSELEFLLERTNQKIAEVRSAALPKNDTMDR